MDVLGWLWWLLSSLVSVLWSVAWFLLGGWVATLAQIAVIALIFLATKYGWRRAPQEFVSRATAFGRFVWAWIRSKEATFQPRRETTVSEGRSRVSVRRRQPGDVRINVSTTLTLMMLAGLALMTTLK
ncbi:MAG: hypothetical protein JSS20_03530 [Proteobacteria bacterium]|nr:hypothetical protein [Pseudomonadota bacterium]